jgi:adenosine deaminase
MANLESKVGKNEGKGDRNDCQFDQARGHKKPGARRAAARNAQGVNQVACSALGREGNPAKIHRQAFQLVIDNNISCTAHAGESFGPDSIHQALHKCGSHRIGHGTRLVENGDLLNYMNDHRIPLEVCPSSNLQTKAATSWANHPVDFYVDYGLRVTINTDNRLITDTTVSKELWLCHKHYGWPLATLKEIIISGFKSAFMPYREKADLLAEISAELALIHAPGNGKAVDRPAAAAPAAVAAESVSSPRVT